jgi:uracil-DNA glycosylase
VLLLNTVLTVREAEANSHKKRGWEEVTDAIIDTVAERDDPAIFVLWGRPAQKKAARIPERHLVLQSAHPSPLSARRGFFDSQPYSRINQQLRAWEREPIDWRVDGE